jgi:hypothetical protein
MRRVIFFLAALILGALTINEALSYDVLWPNRRWFPEQLPREIYVDPRGRTSVNDPDMGVTATLDHIEKWEEAEGVGNLIRPMKGSPSDPEEVPSWSGADGISVLRFDDPPKICTGTCIAATTTGGINLSVTGDCNGSTWYRWNDSDIVFNPIFTFTTEEETATEGDCFYEFYLEQIALHEVGHLLGLGHSSDTSSVMYAYAGHCEINKVNIQPDDALGIQQPYDCPFSQDGVYHDSDGDGFGQDSDCNDQDPVIFPGASEVCDAKDNDCDGFSDLEEGLDCAETCLWIEGGPGLLNVESGLCAGEPVPGFRNVFARGILEDMLAASEVQEVQHIACPSPSVYDRLSESTDLSEGSGWYYLVRDDASPDYGNGSSPPPRTPTEIPCP